MNKKDATTKFKALQIFAELCRGSTLSSVSRLFCHFGHVCIVCSVSMWITEQELVERVGKSVALYLKQQAGAWFTSQFDTYPPAASSATNCAQESFPQRKIVDVVIHCHEEILSYISDTVTVQNPQSTSTHKTLMAEEFETKNQRLLIASLQARCSYLEKVLPAQIEKT